MNASQNVALGSVLYLVVEALGLSTGSIFGPEICADGGGGSLQSGGVAPELGEDLTAAALRN
jgi:hypothetical protein